jgi:Fe-S cluster assembly protein SufD
MDYGLNLNRLDIPVNPYEVFKCDVPNMSTSLFFVVNDSFYKKELPKSNLPEGVVFSSLNDFAAEHPEVIEKYYAKLADNATDGTIAFNTTFVQDGVVLYVPKKVVVDKTIQLVNILRSDVNFMMNRRLLIILEDNAQARLLVCDHAMDPVHFLVTQVAEVYVGKNAQLDLYELEETHNNTVRVSNMFVNQEADSRVLLNNMTLHNGTTRNTTRVTLSGRGADTNVCGMAIADKSQHVDNNTFIDHAVADCTSNELFKYVLDDSAVGALQEPYWFVPMPNAPVRSKPTVTFVLPAMRACTHSLSWRYMPMMCDAVTEQRWDSSTRTLCSTCVPAV